MCLQNILRSEHSFKNSNPRFDRFVMLVTFSVKEIPHKYKQRKKACLLANKYGGNAQCKATADRAVVVLVKEFQWDQRIDHSKTV